MSVAVMSSLPTAVHDQEENIDEPPYLWSDLLARRNALSLRVEDLVPVLRVDMSKYRSRETGALVVGPYLVDFLWPAESRVVELDGYRFHRGRSAFEADRARDLELRRRGYEVVRLTWRQLEADPARIAAAIRALLSARPPR